MRRRVLTRLVVAAVAAGVLAGTAGAAVLQWRARRALGMEVARRNETGAVRMAARFDERVETMVDKLQLVASGREISALGAATPSELHVALRSVAELEQLVVYDLDGRPLAAAVQGLVSSAERLQPRPELAADLDAERVSPHRRSSFRLALGEPPLVEIAVHIENPPGTPVGVLLGAAPVSELAERDPSPALNPAASHFIVDGRGRVLSQPVGQRTLPGGGIGIAPLRNRPRSATMTLEGESYLVTLAPSARLPLAVGVREPERAAVARASGSIIELILILIVVVLVTVLAVSAVGSYLLRPLRTLAGAANRLGQGDDTVRVPERGDDDVGLLSREFNRMADALELRITELRERRDSEERLRLDTRIAETLQEVGSALTEKLQPDEVVQAVTDTATTLSGAQVGAFVGEDGSSALSSRSAGGLRDFPVSAAPPPSDLGGIVRVDDAQPGTPGSAAGAPMRSYLVVPVRARSGELLGRLMFAHALPGMFTELHERIVGGIAAQASVAIENARLFAEQRSVAETLQRSLLPQRLPPAPGLLMAARYLPGGPHVGVGGDWYDVIELPGGVLGIAMGDVAGRGIGAAVVMGEIRNAVRAYALDGHGPADVLQRVNRQQMHQAPDVLATIVYGELSLETFRLRFACAGHPPPLLVERVGNARYLDGPRGVPIGVVAGVRYEEAEVFVEPGSTVVLYTDGLVERRDLPLDQGLERLRLAAQHEDADLEAKGERLVATLLDGTPAADDVALLLLQRDAGPPKAIIVT